MKNLRLATLTLLAAIGLYGQKYDVRLSPPDHAGHTYVVSMKGSRSQLALSGERVLGKEDYGVEFQGRAEILAVDGKGRPIRIAFTVERFTKAEGGNVVELLKPGSVIVADGSLKVPLSLKEGEMGEAARQAFGVLHSPHKPGDLTDDEVFGTTEPKSIGDSWPMNSKLASEDLGKTGPQIPPERLLGTTTLAGKEKFGDADCLSVRAELKADGLTMKDPPPGFTMDRGSMEAGFRGCFPINGALSYRSAQDATFEIRLISKDLTINSSFKQNVEEAWSDTGK